MTTFPDRQFLIHLGLTLAGTAALLVIVKVTNTIHWPFLAGAIVAIGIGFLEPRRGWRLALVQAGVLWLGYQLLPAPESPADRQIETFGLYGTILLTFVGSAIGGLLKRALDRH